MLKNRGDMLKTQRTSALHWRLSIGGLLVAATALVGCGGSDASGESVSPPNPGNPAPGASLTVGGTLSGLGSGKSLVLRNNGGNDLTLSANGGFTFTTALRTGSAYAVTVLTQPVGQTCTVSGGSGTASANVSNVVVACTNNPAPGACSAPAFTPGGSDGRGGCFAGPTNAGVPSGTVLTNYSGSCTISVAGTVIDSAIISCAPLLISAPNVTVSKSRIMGFVAVASTEGVWSGGSNSNSLFINDTEIVGPTSIDNNSPTGLGEMHWYAKRISITGFRRSAHCLRECTLEDSFLKQDGTPLPGSTREPYAIHASGLRAGPNMLIRGNTIHCAMKDVEEAGCSSNLTIYGEYGQQHHITVENNFFPATGGGYCVYGGDSHGRTDANYIVFKNNTFGRRSDSQHTVNGAGTCGYYGTATSFTAQNTGNVWTGNVYAPDLNAASYPY